MDASNVWKAFIAAVGTAATYLWGGWDAVFTALVVVVPTHVGVNRSEV